MRARLILPAVYCINVSIMPRKIKRLYSSPLRERQSATTRARIITAAVALLAEHPSDELSHENVSREAGIAVRTAYRHFPKRADLLDAVWEHIDDRLGLSELAANNSAELIALVPDLFHRFDNNAEVVAALITSNTGHELSRRTGERRLQSIERALEQETGSLPRIERDRLNGLVRVLTSPLTWHVLRQKTRVTGAEPARAVTWALETLIETAKRGSAMAGD